jgi:eukaryotic-like serine/threonine-protein kinase
VPFSGDSAVAIAYKHVQENPMPPRRVDPSLPETLEAITLKCLAKNPANRYPSAQDLRADLRRYLDGSRILAEPVLAPPVDPGATGLMAPTSYGDQTAFAAGPVTWQPHDDGYGDYDDYPRYDDEQPKRSKWFLAALILLLLVLAGLLFLLARNFGGGDGEDSVAQVTVPGVVGKQVDVAKGELEAAGFEVATVPENSDQPANQVTEQSPPAGERVDEGSKITLTFSSGPEPVAVPDVVGKSQTEASRILSEAGFIPNAVPVEDATVEEGLVVSQDPAANQQLGKGGQVTINVSSGPGAVTVPDVTNQSQGTARTTLQQAGFTTIETREQASDDVPAGTVIGTDPPAGSQVAKTDPITLIVSSGAERITVPSVQGLTEENAKSALEGLGLNVKVTDQRVAIPTQDGIVLTQTPAASSQADKGDEVTIFVGKFEAGPGNGGG